MSRTPLPFHSDDISALARSLKAQLVACDHQPSHLELLNMLARSSGYRNFQHFRAELSAREELASADKESKATDENSVPVDQDTESLGAQLNVRQLPPEPEPVDTARIKRLLRVFDSEGRLMRWPSKRSLQELCLWVLWSRLPAQEVFSEAEINRRLNADHLFGDHALLRRWLCDYGMMSRTRDGREYRRIERRPPPEALALIQLIGSAASD